ncbi:MAG: ABC transporter ATP-binding protein [Acidimicrobiales bacterium]
MGANTAVDVVDVSKRFRLYHEKYYSLKERVLHAGRNPYDDFWALQNVNLEVNEGYTVGIVGRNGSGKSTLLKCITGILQPTDGKVIVRGQVAAVLELGAGFQPELSGRENIYLNASLLGLSTREVDRRFDDIVAFAELEQFIDNQVKYYSSGMYVRLGFAVAVNVDPDVLVIDEVLAVGDEDFARRCLARIREFQDDGRTIVFVTHSSDLVCQVCDRGMVLNEGKVIGEGTAVEAIHLYHDHLLKSGDQVDVEASGAEAEASRPMHRPILITAIDLEHPGTGSRPYLFPGEPLAVRVMFEATEPVGSVVFNIEIFDHGGELVFASDTAILNKPFDAAVGSGRVDFSFDTVPLLEGSYTVSVGISSDRGIIYDRWEQKASFDVMNPGRSRGTVALEPHADFRTFTLS